MDYGIIRKQQSNHGNDDDDRNRDTWKIQLYII